jgi:hypothetical protein
MAKWSFYAIDNGGKRQFFTVTAKTKPEAIEKGTKRAKRNAAGDLNNWECKLKQA